MQFEMNFISIRNMMHIKANQVNMYILNALSTEIYICVYRHWSIDIFLSRLYYKYNTYIYKIISLTISQ